MTSTPRTDAILAWKPAKQTGAYWKAQYFFMTEHARFLERLLGQVEGDLRSMRNLANALRVEALQARLRLVERQQ
jgi:hypothetical protein